MTPRALVIVSLFGAAALNVAACSDAYNRGRSPVPEPQPIVYAPPVERRVDPVHRSAPPPPAALMECRSQWCKENCTVANPNLPKQCQGFRLVGGYHPRPDVQGNASPAPISPAGELCRSADKC